jgi:PKD repeat protein
VALTDNLIAYWAMDGGTGNETDEVGSIVATQVGTPGSVTGHVHATARSFGTAQGFSVSDAGLRLDEDFTIAAWVKRSGTADSALWLQSNLSNAGATCRYLFGSAFYQRGYFGGTNQQVTKSTTADLDTWTLVVQRVGENPDGGNRYHELAVWPTGGSLQESSLGSLSSAYSPHDADLYIGCQDGSGTNSYAGAIGPVMVWDRYLSDADITELYNDGDGWEYTPAVSAPVAAFSGTPTSGSAPLTVAFTDESTNTPTSWAWTFGDEVGSGTLPASPPATPAMNIFFPTNSFGSYADVDYHTPATIMSRLADAAGFATPNIVVRAIGGASLDTHYADIATNPTLGIDHASVDSDLWNYIIMHEVSTGATDEPEDTQFTGDAVQNYEAYRDHASGKGGSAKIILYETHAYHEDHGNYDAGQVWDGLTPDDLQERIRANYELAYDDIIALGGSCDLARSGEVFRALGFADALYENINAGTTEDWAHPGSVGMWVIGMTLFAAIFGVSPTTLDYATISADNWDALTEEQWDDICAAIDGVYANQGVPPSSDQNPEHIYASAGTYTVELTATNAGGSDAETKAGYITVTEPAAAPEPHETLLVHDRGLALALEEWRMSRREVIGGTRVQGVDESIVYALDTTAWGGSPSSPAVTAEDMTASDADVTSTVLSGSASASGNIVTLPALGSLTAGHQYRIKIAFEISGNTLVAELLVRAE